jgi:hypothetical protein
LFTPPQYEPFAAGAQETREEVSARFLPVDMGGCADCELDTARVARETALARHARVYSPAFVNAALQGETLNPDGTYTAHPGAKCSHCLPNGQPCWYQLWPDKARYEMHLETFDISQENRSAYVFSRLEGAHGYDEDAHGNAIGAECWHYRLAAGLVLATCWLGAG